MKNDISGIIKYFVLLPALVAIGFWAVGIWTKPSHRGLRQQVDQLKIEMDQKLAKLQAEHKAQLAELKQQLAMANVQKGAHTYPGETGEDNSGGEIPIVEEGDNIVTNVAGSNGSRYLMVEIFLKRGRKDDKLFRDHIKANSKKFKKIVIDRISVLDMQECGDPSVRSRIMAQLQSSFQIVLDDSYGQGKHPIKELILATWVMQ